MKYIYLLYIFLQFTCISGRFIHFHTASIDTSITPQYHETKHYSLHVHTNQRYQFLLQLIETSTTDERIEIETILLQPLIHYYNEHTWLVYITYEQLHELSSLSYITWIGLYQNVYKLHENIHNGFHLKNQHVHPMSINRTHQIIPDDYGLHFLNVHLPIEHTDEEINLMINTWKQYWINTHNVNINIKKVKPNKLIIHLHNGHLVSEITDYLTQQPMVHIITRRPKIHLLNQWSRSITSNGINLPDYTSKSDMLSYEYNLHGNNQIIGIGDSGLDWQSCFFYDTEYPKGPIFREYSDTATNKDMFDISDAKHRKIVQYITFGDHYDDNGHGTHVCGSAVGNTGKKISYDTLNGIADEAKIAFFDLGVGENGGLEIPDSIDTHYLQWAYTAGARIHSNSWGGDYTGYDTEAQEMDAFQWVNKNNIYI
jgi:hypothetical protein